MRHWLAVGFLVAAIVQGAESGHADEIGVVKSVVGEVSVLRSDVRTPAVIGQSLQLNDRLQTMADSAVGVALNDGTTLALSGETDVVLAGFAFSPATDLFDLVIRLFTGRLIYNSGKIGLASPERVRIETPRLVVGTRGTRFAVIVPPPS